MRFVYHPEYDLNLGEHVFPAQKFRLIREQLTLSGVSKSDILLPEPASKQDLLLAHDAGWIERLQMGRLSPAEIRRLEIPWSPEMARAFLLAAGGSILAARTALQDRISFNIGGGFHHAFRDHGEGFCAINDIAVAVQVLRRDNSIARAMVVDCDVHHGNGTAALFLADPSVFTLSIHQLNNYPFIKPPSDLDIDLDDATGDLEYLELLERGLNSSFASFHPELVFFVAGADPYFDDQLGGLALTIEGLRRRDELVISLALQAGASVAVALAGGYARKVQDTVSIHVQTAMIAQRLSPIQLPR